MLLRRFTSRPWSTGSALVSLAIGLCAFLVLTGIARYELSYDQWVPNGDRVFRFEMTLEPAGAPEIRTTSLSARAGAMLAARLPDVQASARAMTRSQSWTIDGRQFEETTILTEPGFLRIFPLKRVGGNLEEALARPDRVAISRTTAEKLFGTAEATGRTVLLSGSKAVSVAGVFEDLPRNSHLEADAIASIRSPLFVDLAAAEEDWLDLRGYFYLKTADASEARQLGELATDLLKREAAVLESSGIKVTIGAFPLGALHARSPSGGDLPIGGFKPLISSDRVLLVQVVAILLAALAAFNFSFYLATLVAERSREIALRQFFGATPFRIYLLFWTEALVAIAVAFGAAVLLASETRPWWTNFAEGEPGLTDIASTINLGAMLGAVLFLVSAVALFPYRLASTIRPAETLHNRAAASAVRSRFIRVIMGGQVAFAASLMLGALAVTKQVDRISSAPLGFDQNGVLVVKSLPPNADPVLIQSLLQRLTRQPAILGAAVAQDEAGVGLNRSSANVEAPSLPRELSFNYMAVDGRWLTLMGVVPRAGRLLDERQGDRLGEGPQEQLGPTPVVLNETAARQLGFASAAAAIGRPMKASLGRGRAEPLTIIGVIPDIAQASLREGPKPTFYIHDPAQERILYVRFTGDPAAARARVAQALKPMFPDKPPATSMLAEDISNLYRDEGRLRLVFATGSLVMLAIALMGIAALANTIVSYKRKEIALRKLFGAPVGHILRLVTRLFAPPLLGGYAVGASVAWLVIQQWLQGFSLRSPPDVTEFLAVLVVITLACALTASWYVVRLVRLRPASVLRYE
ncbi:MAG TPA: ABC transporter permease [Allosphingosinicella sp.]|nr:ABC transporter permease [Allosphingosinicella sp.]